MHHSSPIHTTASSLPAGKITRKQVAAHYGLCVRIIDNLTRSGVLGHYRIGKSIRYDLAEVEATLRARFHVGGTGQQGRAGCPQPAASKRRGTGEKQNLQESLRPAIHESHAHAAAANAGTVFQDAGEETHDGGLRTSRPTSNRPTASRPASRRASARSEPSTTQA